MNQMLQHLKNNAKYTPVEDKLLPVAVRKRRNETYTNIKSYFPHAEKPLLIRTVIREELRG